MSGSRLANVFFSLLAKAITKALAKVGNVRRLTSTGSRRSRGRKQVCGLSVEAVAVDLILLNLIAHDALGCIKQLGSFGAVAACCF